MYYYAQEINDNLLKIWKHWKVRNLVCTHNLIPHPFKNTIMHGTVQNEKLEEKRYILSSSIFICIYYCMFSRRRRRRKKNPSQPSPGISKKKKKKNIREWISLSHFSFSNWTIWRLCKTQKWDTFSRNIHVCPYPHSYMGQTLYWYKNYTVNATTNPGLYEAFWKRGVQKFFFKGPHFYGQVLFLSREGEKKSQKTGSSLPNWGGGGTKSHPLPPPPPFRGMQLIHLRCIRFRTPYSGTMFE